MERIWVKTFFFWSSPNFGQKNGLILSGEIFLLVFIILKFSAPIPFENPAYASGQNTAENIIHKREYYWRKAAKQPFNEGSFGVKNVPTYCR